MWLARAQRPVAAGPMVGPAAGDHGAHKRPCWRRPLHTAGGRWGRLTDRRLARVPRRPGTGTVRTDEERPVPEQCRLGAGRSERSRRSEPRGASRSEPHPTVSRRTDGSLWGRRGLYVKGQVNVTAGDDSGLGFRSLPTRPAVSLPPCGSVLPLHDHRFQTQRPIEDED